MRKEIDKAVETYHRIAFGTGKKGRQLISDKQLASFVTVLTELLVARYKNTWYPENPTRGSGYRCLRVNSQCMDPTIQESLKRSKINLNNAQRAMELTIWVDPGVVSIRIGEDGSIGTEDVEMEPPRRDSVSSEDEAYASRSPSPVSNSPADKAVQVSPSKPSVNQSSPASTPVRAPLTKVVPGAIYQQRVSPPSLSNARLTASRSLLHAMSNTQEYLPSGHIPTSSQSSYSRPKTLFPPQDMPVNGNGFKGNNFHDSMMIPHHSYHAAMAMRMPRSMHYMDIPAQA